MNPTQTGFLFRERDDLYYAAFDGSKAVRLTQTNGREELPTLAWMVSPWPLLRNNDLYTVDLATQTEHRLTNDGGDKIFNGKADWVYYEEIFDRNYKAFWWSPRFAFARLRALRRQSGATLYRGRSSVDDAKAGADTLPESRLPESVRATRRRTRDRRRSALHRNSRLQAGRHATRPRCLAPDSSDVLFYLTDRAQSWLDVMAVSPAAMGTLTGAKACFAKPPRPGGRPG